MPPARRATRKVREKFNAVLGARIDKKPAEKKQKPLPLVERTNKLSREEFVSSYIPTSELGFQKERKTKNERTKKAQYEENEPSSTSTSISSETETDSHDLSIYTAATIPPSELDLCFDLIESTSSAAYKDSSMGWSASEKRKEMKLPDMKYMILRRRADASSSAGDGSGEDAERDRDGDGAGEFAGFLEFMVTYEDGYEVLYCYEIHLTPESQGQGLGEELMQRFERIGKAVGLEKTMLTVFKSNKRAIKFYERVGYEEDENSPRPRKLRNGTVKEADYLIMSKNLR
ncbi:N-terminal L-serine N(alpha)-acetyltransferase NAT4 [Aspergillus stella-maris]|uniref:N-terminal L-serine N(alpha)-acetyltransferase NAT4 n=1 Tax=Aspergillus stella-maris TaxID=1810926 RepID=UPI003CCD9FF5